MKEVVTSAAAYHYTEFYILLHYMACCDLDLSPPLSVLQNLIRSSVVVLVTIPCQFHCSSHS